MRPATPAAKAGPFATLRGSVREQIAFARTPASALLGAALLIAFAAAPNLASAQAACPNESLREAQGEAGLALPDCRAYELVSPPGPQKNGVDAQGSAGLVQAAPSGDAISYFAETPFTDAAGSGGGEWPIYLASRSSLPSWSNRGLLPSPFPAAVVELVGQTEDLAESLVLVAVASTQSFAPPCEPAVSVCAAPGEANLYLEHDATGAFQLVAVGAGNNTGTVNPAFDAASADGSRLLFQTKARLLEGAHEGAGNLYLWDESQPEGQRLSLVGLVPSSGASCSGAGCLAPVSGSSAGNSADSYNQQTISADGSRAFFADNGSRYLYERLLDAGQTIRVSAAAATFREATPDGRYVFYTEAGGLYRFDTVAYEEAIQASKTEAEAFAAATTALTGASAGLLGDLGVSTDGATAYFAATAALTGSEENEWGARAQEGALAVNVYRWHGGSTTFIATLRGPGPGEPNDEADWRNYPSISVESGTSGGNRSSRLTPDGAVLLFASLNPLTSYDNAAPCGAKTCRLPEFYRYDSAAPPGRRLRCVTCDPSGAAPTGWVRLENSNPAPTGTPPSLSPFLTRNLSPDGSRIFFEAEGPLVPADVNGANDVYEWEAPGATGGSCEESSSAFSSQDAGCLYLISTGTAPQGSYFGDASASGEDAFFFTRQPLLSSDTDQNVDLYDAKVGGGIAAQNPPAPPPPCEEAEACKPRPTEPPSEQTAPEFVGPTNPTYCRRGFALRHGACVRRKHRRHHARHANNNRRAGK
jgi:hypothetical protein